jgi:hypothetical protein
MHHAARGSSHGAVLRVRVPCPLHLAQHQLEHQLARSCMIRKTLGIRSC